MFGRCDFNELRVVWSSVAIADEDISIGETFHASDPSQGNSRQVGLLDFPDHFLLWVDFQDTVAVAGSDESIAVGQPEGAEDRVAKRLWAVAGFAWFAEEGDVVIPDDSAGWIVLAHRAVVFVGNEVIAIGDLADEPGVRMWIGLIDLEGDLAMDLSGVIDFDDSGGTGFGDHGEAILEALESVHFDAFAGVSIAFCGVIFPDDLVFRGHFNDAGPSLLEENVAIGQDRGVVDGADFCFPFERAIGSHDGEPSGGIVGGQDASRRTGLGGLETGQAQGEAKDEGEEILDHGGIRIGWWLKGNTESFVIAEELRLITITAR